MRSDNISIDSKGHGFSEAVAETKKAAAYMGLSDKQSLRLQLITEELMSLARSVGGEMAAVFWLENEGQRVDLHLSTKIVMNTDRRSQLLSAATSRKNEAAKGFLGKLRDMFEEAMTAEADYSSNDIPIEVWRDIPNRLIDDPDWDGYERSVLKSLADEIKIGIRGQDVDMTVSKSITE